MLHTQAGPGHVEMAWIDKSTLPIFFDMSYQ